MNNISYIIDTNFIVRYLINDNEEHYKIAVKFFQQVKDNKLKAILTESVITEVIFVLSSYYKISRDKIVKVLTNFMYYKGLITSNKEIILEALSLFEKSNLHIVDSILAAHTKLQNIKLMTFDDELKKYIS